MAKTIFVIDELLQKAMKVAGVNTKRQGSVVALIGFCLLTFWFFPLVI